jgi:hypothetical protein
MAPTLPMPAQGPHTGETHEPAAAAAQYAQLGAGQRSHGYLQQGHHVAVDPSQVGSPPPPLQRVQLRRMSRRVGPGPG